MAFPQESFWVATSAVAPVIALAAVVALPDATLVGRARTLLNTIQQRQHSKQDDKLHAFLESEARYARNWALIALWITLANLIIQTVLLVVSLCALAFRQDTMPLWLAICLATSGIPLLALSTFVSAKQRWLLEGGLFRKGSVADSYLSPADSADSGP